MEDDGIEEPAPTAWEKHSRVINQAIALRDFAVQNGIPFNFRFWFRGGWEILRQDLYDYTGDYFAYSLVVGRNGKLRLYKMSYSGLRQVPLMYIGYDPDPIEAAIQKFISEHQAAA